MKKIDYQKLNQLDKIEYLLLRERLSKKNPTGFTTEICYGAFMIIMFMTIIGLLMYLGFKDLRVLQLVIELRKVIYIALVIGLVLDISFLVQYHKQHKGLIDYFKNKRRK